MLSGLDAAENRRPGTRAREAGEFDGPNGVEGPARWSSASAIKCGRTARGCWVNERDRRLAADLRAYLEKRLGVAVRGCATRAADGVAIVVDSSTSATPRRGHRIDV